MEQQHKTARRHLTALALALLMFILPAALPGTALLRSAQAQEGGEYLVLFENGPAEGWELDVQGPEVGWWIDREGETGNQVLHGRGHVFATYVEGGWENYRLHCRVWLQSETAIHLNVRQSNQGRYYIGFSPWGMTLRKESPWGRHSGDLVTSEEPHDVGRWHTIDISVDGPYIEAFVNGTMELSYKDPDPLPGGTISFETLDYGDTAVDQVGVEVYAPPSQPDLAILAADQWEVSRDGRVLGLYVEIINRGSAESPRTQVWAGEESRGWESALVNVPPLVPGEITTVLIELEIDDRQRGSAHSFDVGIDPDNRLPDDADRDNNWARTPRIEIPDQEPTPTYTPTRGGAVAPQPVITQTPTRTRTPTATPTRTRTSPAPPPPSPGPTGIPDWVWVGTTLLLSGASFAVGRNLGVKTKLLWTDQGHIQWHVEAQNKLPDAKTPCKWACQVNVSADLLDRWQLKALELTSGMRLRGGNTPPPKRVEGDALKPLDSLANIASIWHRPEAVRQRLAPVVDALLKEVLSWEEEGQTPPSIRLDATLKAPISAQFKLYHCQQSLKGLQWVEWLKWKKKLNQPAGEFVGVFRGPTAGEADFRARARQELEDCLMELVSVVRFRL